jgi:hypothetical protein
MAFRSSDFHETRNCSAALRGTFVPNFTHIGQQEWEVFVEILSRLCVKYDCH